MKEILVAIFTTLSLITFVFFAMPPIRWFFTIWADYWSK